jgi:hypothetical protein
VGGGAFVPFSRILQESADKQGSDPKESLAQFPDHMLSTHWARLDNTLCILSDAQIECATMTPTEKLNAQDHPPEWSEESYPPLASSRPTAFGASTIEPALKGIRCIRCELVNLYISHEVKSGPADIVLNFNIGVDGRVTSFAVSGNIPNEVAHKIKTSSQSWLFEPPAQGDKAKPVLISLRGRVMIMNPDSR